MPTRWEALSATTTVPRGAAEPDDIVAAFEFAARQNDHPVLRSA